MGQQNVSVDQVEANVVKQLCHCKESQGIVFLEFWDGHRPVIDAFHTSAIDMNSRCHLSMCFCFHPVSDSIPDPSFAELRFKYSYAKLWIHFGEVPFHSRKVGETARVLVEHIERKRVISHLVFGELGLDRV